MINRYCGKEVNICHGSRYINEATKYNPNVAARAISMIPELVEEKKVLKNRSAPCFTSMEVSPLPLPVRALTTRNIDRTIK